MNKRSQKVKICTCICTGPGNYISNQVSLLGTSKKVIKSFKFVFYLKLRLRLVITIFTLNDYLLHLRIKPEENKNDRNGGIGQSGISKSLVNMSSAMCALSKCSRLCMKMLSFLFVRV